MFRRFSLNFAAFSIILDAVLVVLALSVATQVRPSLSSLPIVKDILQPVKLSILFYLIFPLVWVGVFMLLTVYDGRRNYRVVDELTNVTFGSLLAAISLAGIIYFFSSREVISRLVFLSFAGLVYSFQVTWRLIIRLLYRWRIFREVQTRHLLIVGAGEVGRNLQGRVVKYGYDLELAGFLDDDRDKQGEYPDEILGPLGDIRRVVRHFVIDDVVLALPLRAHQKVNYLVSELHDLPVKVWVIPDYFSMTLHKAEVLEFAGIPMLDLRAPALSPYQRLAKRLFDLVVSLVLLVLILPIMGLIYVAIYLDDRGAALFPQKRVGENGHLFIMYKFRTMIQNAELLRHQVEKIDENGNVIHKVPDDPRVTRVGRFLRRTSLDELPQLFNVLKGEMSLVGPRPELPDLVERYEPWQRKRFAVPQGITGWWQVNGRSDKPMHLHTEEDLFYVQNYSLWLDLQILFKTVGVALRGRGAF